MVIQKSEMEDVLRLFKAGRSKSEIGKAIGRDKKQVARIISEAIRASAQQKGMTNGISD